MNLEIAARLVELRRARCLSQEDLADQLGVSRQAVSKWERGESSPDTDNLIALAGIYDVSLDALLLGRTDGTVPPPEEIAPEQEEGRQRRRLLSFPYPVFIALVYLLAGIWLNLWHPGWVIFLTIPLYYWYVGTH